MKLEELFEGTVQTQRRKMKLEKIVENREVIVIDRERQKDKTKTPPMYNVILHNDDYVSGEIVHRVVCDVFSHNTSAGLQLMLKAHRDGYAVVGTYAKDVAETKATKGVRLAGEYMKQLAKHMDTGDDVSSQLFTIRAA